jgi:hypothetical protein
MLRRVSQMTIVMVEFFDANAPFHSAAAGRTFTRA